jgi:hypothetical protein
MTAGPRETTMSEWMDGYQHTEKWLKGFARLEGSIEAHRILKAGQGDEYDLLLWKMFDEIRREVDDA